MINKLAMVIDAGRCLDCKACQAACKVANRVPEGQWRNWIKAPDLGQQAAARKRTVFQPGNCMQCDKPTCLEACPTGATFKDRRDGGVVKVDRELCIACGQCIAACPYGARFRNQEVKAADKCDFCASRRAEGLEPACVSTCPTKARSFGNLGDPNSEVARLLASRKTSRVDSKKTPTSPNIYYLGDPGLSDWPCEAKMPGALALWKNLADPLVKAFVGLTGLGVVAMLGRQLMLKDEPPRKEEGGGHE